MPLNCPQVVSKLKAYKKQHQDLKQQFSDLMSQVPFLPDVKWDEPFMSSPYYKDITNAPKNIFDNLYDAKEEARVKLEELKDEVPEIRTNEIINLKEQYNSQVEVLTQSNILEQLSNGEMGIRGVDGKEYPLPTYQEFLYRFTDQEKRTLLETKAKQGFTKLLLVPFAMPLSVFIQRYKEILLKTHKETGIKSTDGTKLELDTDDPLYVWKVLVQSDNPDTDKSQQIEYGVKTYDGQTKEARGGKYKSELLQDPNNAWQVNFVEATLDIPARGQGKTISSRTQIEAGESCKKYLQILQTDYQYQGESGQTPEGAIFESITTLNQEQIAIHSVSGNYLVGNYFYCNNSSTRNIDVGYVPSLSFDHGFDNQYYLVGVEPNLWGSPGCRPTVRF